jgi:hypothetical protein
LYFFTYLFVGFFFVRMGAGAIKSESSLDNRPHSSAPKSLPALPVRASILAIAGELERCMEGEHALTATAAASSDAADGSGDCATDTNVVPVQSPRSSVVSRAASAALVSSTLTSGPLVVPQGHNVHLWSVRYPAAMFPPESTLGQGLRQLGRDTGVDFIEVELSFARGTFPYRPPQLRLVRPRLGRGTVCLVPSG